MRVLVLPRVAELCDCPLFAVGNEDRVVAEALAAARLRRDAPFEDPGASGLAAVRRDRDELGDVTRAPVIGSPELAEQLRDRGRALRCVARRVQPRAAVERGDFDAGVLADRPTARALVAEPRLDARVVDVRLASLGRIVVRVERLDRPAGEQLLELARLVRVTRAESCFHSLHRTSSTPSRSATSATILGAVPSRISTSIATLRRSPSCATSSASTLPNRSTTSIRGAGLPPAGISTSRRSTSGRKRRIIRYAAMRSGPSVMIAPRVAMIAAS